MRLLRLLGQKPDGHWSPWSLKVFHLQSAMVVGKQTAMLKATQIDMAKVKILGLLFLGPGEVR